MRVKVSPPRKGLRMAKKRPRLEDDIATALDHWAISEKAKENLVKSLSREGETEETIEPAGGSDQASLPAADAVAAPPVQALSQTESAPSESDPQNLTVEERPSDSDPQKLTVNDRPSDSDSHKLTVNYRPADIDPQNLTVNDRSSETDRQQLTVNYRPSDSDPQPLTVNNRPSDIDSQKLTVRNRQSDIDPHKQGDPSESGIASIRRTFRGRPVGEEEPERTRLLDNIPKRHFFPYYNALHDQILPQAPKNSRLLLVVLFRFSHGFNRNWCRISFRELGRLTGSTPNTLRANLKGLIEGGWVTILADGYNESTTYILSIQADIKEDLENGLDPQQSTLKDRGSNLDPQALPERPSFSDPQELRPCTSSTTTGHLTGRKPDSHRPEVEHGLVEGERNVPEGENQVRGNLALKRIATPETRPRSSPSSIQPGALSEIESAYIYSRPSHEQSEIFDAQDTWEEVFGQGTRPTASKLDEMLGHLRERGYRGEVLIGKLRGCLEKTKGRADDPVGWMISALKHGRYA